MHFTIVSPAISHKNRQRTKVSRLRQRSHDICHRVYNLYSFQVCAHVMPVYRLLLSS